MRPKANTIELNGKRYDAKTGKYIGAAVAAGGHPKLRAKAGRGKGSIDGLSKRVGSSAKKPAPRQGITVANSIRRKTEKSRTLMRASVKKPAPSAAKTAAPTVRKHGIQGFDSADPRLIARSMSIKKSPRISKFAEARKRAQYTAEILPVKPAPAREDFTPTRQKVSAPPAHLPARQESTRQKIINKALRDATSHKQPRPKKPTRRQRLSKKLRISSRVMNIAAAGLAVLLLGGFIAYQNMANLSMRVAAVRAGVNGTLPSYRPAGFGLAGPIQYEHGKVTVTYASHSDERRFSIEQRATNWNSEALQDNFLSGKRKTFQEFQSSGKTIYVYDDNNATWIDGGVWYQIEGNSALSNDQLIRMAVSM